MGAPAAFTELQIRRNWHTMSALFGLSHGVITTPLVYATAFLDPDVGYAGSALLFIFMCVGALFVSVPVVETMSQRKSFTFATSLCTLYIGSFTLACALVRGSLGQWVVFLPGSCLGGLAA